MITNRLETYLKCSNMNASMLEDLHIWKNGKGILFQKGHKEA